MKRICIYLTYDKEKKVDKYIGYMLKELRTCTDYLAVVCNYEEIFCGAEILEENADVVFYRENKGFDAGGFKDALCRFLGWDEIEQYDQLILVNDSMFGPFRPMKDIFSEMDRRPADFWGLAKHGENRTSSLGYIAEHIQSFFIVIRFKMLHSIQFREFWNQLPYFTSFSETIKKYEILFTKYFSELGFTYDSLAETQVNDSENGIYNYAQYGYIPYEMIKKRNFPFLKRQPLRGITQYYQTQESFRRAIDYIDKQTDYDVNLIWDNIIRTFNISDLQRSLHLQYIISPEQREGTLEKTAIIIFVSHQESLESILEYIAATEYNEIFYIVSKQEEYLENYRKQGLKCINLEAVKFSQLAAFLSGYSFVCFLHDTDLTTDNRPGYIGKSYFFHIWDNLLKNRNHVLGIIDYFFQEPRLGLLMPPQPNFGDYFGEYGKGWNGKWDSVSKLVKRLRIHCQISRQSAPFRVTDNLWIRGCILKRIAGFNEMEIELLPYLWGYLAQDAGYYSGIVESLEYTSMNEVNLQHYLQETASQIRRYGNNFRNFREMKENMLVHALQEFCRQYEKIFVYGAGDMARRYSAFIPNIETYVVSDGMEKEEELYGIPIRFLSHIQVSDCCGMVLCLDDKNQAEVMPLLEKQGIKKYFCI